MAKALTLKLIVRYIEPTIWRRIKISEDLTFLDLHFAIQILFEWEGTHLFEFRSKDLVISEPSGFDYVDSNKSKVTLPDNIRLVDVFKKVKQDIVYTYDFGDNWEIEVVLEEIVSIEESAPLIVFLGGQEAGPLEDIGGAQLFMEMKEAYLNPVNPAHLSVKAQWDEIAYQPRLMPKELITQGIQKYNQILNSDGEELLELLDVLEEELDELADDNHHVVQEDVLNDENLVVIPDLKLTHTDFYYLVTNPFSAASPLSLNTGLPLFSLLQSPYFNLATKLLTNLAREGKLKATAKGNLPRKIVQELFDVSIVPRIATYLNSKSVGTEFDFEELFTIRTVAKMAGLIKKQKGYFSLTKKGEKLIQDKQAPHLFNLLFETYFEKFNWSYWDGFEDEHFGQFGIGLILLWLKKYGTAEKLTEFYFDKYRSTFAMYHHPNFRINTTPSQLQADEESFQQMMMETAFNVRVFDRGLANWGLVQYRREGLREDFNYYVRGTFLLEQLVS